MKHNFVPLTWLLWFGMMSIVYFALAIAAY